MSPENMDKFLSTVEELYNMKLPPNNQKTQAWKDRFDHVPFEVAMAMAKRFYNQTPLASNPFLRTVKVRPDDLFVVYEQVKKEFPEEVFDDCECCCGGGLIVVKRYLDRGQNQGQFYDYSYRCFCKAGNQFSFKIPRLNENDLSLFTYARKSPHVLIDPYLYDSHGVRTKHYLSNDIAAKGVIKKFSPQAIKKKLNSLVRGIGA